LGHDPVLIVIGDEGGVLVGREGVVDFLESVDINRGQTGPGAVDNVFGQEELEGDIDFVAGLFDDLLGSGPGFANG
jgi:hypothetical protein